MKNIALALAAALVVALATVPAAEAAGPDLVGLGSETCGGAYVNTGSITVCTADYCSGNCTDSPGRQ